MDQTASHTRKDGWMSLKKQELEKRSTKGSKQRGNKLVNSSPKMVDVDLSKVKIEGNNVNSDANIRMLKINDSKGGEQLLTDEAGDLEWADTILED